MDLTTPATARRTVIVAAADGLHARPAAVFVEAAAGYGAAVRIGKPGGPAVEARSILAVLTLDVRRGDAVVLTASGADAAVAVDALAALLGGG